MNNLRDLPSVESLLQSSGKLIDAYGRPLTLDALRSTLDDIRERFKQDLQTVLPSADLILTQAILSLRMDGCDSRPCNQCLGGDSPYESWTRAAK